MSQRDLRQKIISAIQKRPPTYNPLTVLELAKKFRTSKERMAKAVFQLFTERKLEIYGQLVLSRFRKDRGSSDFIENPRFVSCALSRLCRGFSIESERRTNRDSTSSGPKIKKSRRRKG